MSSALNFSAEGLLIDVHRETAKVKESYKRPPYSFSSSLESEIRSIKIHDHMNKPMSNSDSVRCCISNVYTSRADEA